MESFWEKYENYEKNLQCVQDLMGRLLRHMKGQGVSFRREITDGKGDFSQEKLTALVEKILSHWAEKQREGSFKNPSTGESVAEPYIRARWELYGCYLYLVMRCSLCKGDYALVYNDTITERTDFAFLLEQAERLSRDWCVVLDNKDGERRNEPFDGFDRHFGFHIYHVIGDTFGSRNNNFLTEDSKLPWNLACSLRTDEGNKKPSIHIKHFPGKRKVKSAALAEKAEETAQPDEESAAGEGCEAVGGDGNDVKDGYDIKDDYENEEDFSVEEFLDFLEDDYNEVDYFDLYGGDEELRREMEMAEFEAGEEAAQKEADLEYIAMTFAHVEEYLAACNRFAELFRQARPEVLQSFYKDLEAIVDLYLIEQDIPPLMDTDKALEVYSGIFDGPYRKAERYARGVQWQNL